MSTSTGSLRPATCWRGYSTPVGSRRSVTRASAGRGAYGRPAARLASSPTGRPSRSTVHFTAVSSSDRAPIATVSPPPAPTCSPAAEVSRSASTTGAPARVPIRYTCCSLGSPSLASTSSVPSPSRSHTRWTYSPGGVSRLPSANRHRASYPSCASSPPTSTRPSPRYAGVPGTGDTQRGSASSACTWVSPVRGSIASTSPCCCSRRSTVTSGPPSSVQDTATRYGYVSRSQCTSTQPPSRSSRCRVTTAFGAPAWGYATVRGGAAGSAGSCSVQRGTRDSSTRAASSERPSGAHQYPRYRLNSSAAMNSASPQLMPSSPAMSMSGSVTRNAPSFTYAIRVPVGSGRGSTTGPGVGTSATVPRTRSARNSRPASVHAATVADGTIAYEPMPAADSRSRSRRARSPAGRSPASASSAAGSATSRSAPVATSKTYSRSAGSSGPAERRNTTREPSLATPTARGAPHENRRVRAASSGYSIRS